MSFWLFVVMVIAAPVLLVVAALAHIAPMLIESTQGAKAAAAWYFVGYGAEAMALWGAVGLVALVIRWMVSKEVFTFMAALSVWGVVESAQRVFCRLAFPMDRAPKLPDKKNLCDVALGFEVSGLSLVAAGGVAAFCWAMHAANKP